MPSKPMFVSITACVLLGLTPSVRAAPEGAAGPDADAPPRSRPWAENVAEERQTLALRLYEEGNELFQQSQHGAALSKYREALESWDHPAIRYNAAVALILLDQPLAAYENLEPALRYGEAPFAADTYQQALTYQKLLRGQLAHLAVACAEPGAEVTLDGKLIFVGPGRAERWLLPGAHQLVARKTDFLPETRSLNLLAGKSTLEQLALQEIRMLPVKTARRWAVWKPWVVLGVGALAALAGAPFMISAKNNFDNFDAEVAAKCPTSDRCDESAIAQTALDAYDRGRVENVVAISLFAVGGAVAATGVTLLLLNQPRAVAPDESAHAWVTPIVGPGLIGLSLLLR